MTEDKVNDNEAKVNETQISQDLFNVKVKVEGVDEKGSPINAEVDATYPREAVEKPFMAGDEEQHNIRNGFINYVSNYKGITPEQATEWKATVSKDDVFLCEFLCFKEMQSLGYELTTDCSDVERFLALKEDASAQKSWLCAQNHCLNDEEKAKELQRREEIFEN